MELLLKDLILITLAWMLLASSSKELPSLLVLLVLWTLFDDGFEGDKYLMILFEDGFEDLYCLNSSYPEVVDDYFIA
jgi:hypothetical protein